MRQNDPTTRHQNRAGAFSPAETVANCASLATLVAWFVAGWIVLCPLEAQAAAGDLACETPYGWKVVVVLAVSAGFMIGCLVMGCVAIAARARRIADEGFGPCETDPAPWPPRSASPMTPGELDVRARPRVAG